MMKNARPQTIYLKDYQAPDYLVDTIFLTVDIHHEKTRVTSEVSFRRNPGKQNHEADLILNGDEHMLLEAIELNGTPLTTDQYLKTDQTLTIKNPPETFTTRIITTIEPQNNTSLEGLYKSGSMFCTQCEAEGFRKITYYPDRPDVMARFTTTITADRDQYPTLLSNGNRTDHGNLENNRHFVTWEDPFPKPSYLFALVAGNLEYKEDSFTTMSGKKVVLQLFTEAHNISKCDHAMLSLKRSMKWDEEVYGREYDLDLFMIVAVDAFNMGAMENKGLNIFNSSCVLARPDTATDATFQNIESIVGHEYFHNWSGNRVTCRDWFQLSLKEGFTVFRDQEFSADMNSRTLKRVQDVSVLRNAQFTEDAGPLAHPVRPDSFIEISNFYTSTVYDKGAEVVRMLHNIVGKEHFRKGTDLYFARHDGQAVTCDDFVRAIEEAGQVDLSQFKRWYSQAGTPVIDVSDTYDHDKKQYTLTFTQSCPATPGQPEKLPFHIPVSTGLISREDGSPIPFNHSGQSSIVLHVKSHTETFTFDNIPQRPLPSLLQGFSAPVKLNYNYDRDDLLHLIKNDTDGFNRWDSMQRLAISVLIELTEKYQNQAPLHLDECLILAFRAILEDQSADPAMVAEMLKLPSVSYIGEQMEQIDVHAIHAARKFAQITLATELSSLFTDTYERLDTQSSYQPVAKDIARRSLKNVCLSYLAIQEHTAETLGMHKAKGQLEKANNMTDTMAALSALVHARHPDAGAQAEKALQTFASQWKNDANVMDMWFALQAKRETSDVDTIKRLMKHPCFDFKNPNKVRSLIGTFCSQNPAHFHSEDGRGYALLAELVIEMNRINPQIASRLIMPLTRWKRYIHDQQQEMKKALKKIATSEDLSPDVYEVVTRALA